MRVPCIRLFAATLAVAASLSAPVGIAAEIRTAEAIAGEPFGVGALVVAFDGKFAYDPDVLNFRLVEKEGRALYPVYTTEGFLLSTKSRLHIDEIRVDFLFDGTEPLDLTLQLKDGTTVRQTISPGTDGAEHARTLRQWWEWYGGAARDRARSDGSLPQVENYLVSMLAPRLGLKPRTLSNPWSGRKDIDEALGLLMGAESIRVAMQRDVFLKNTDRLEKPSLPLPEAVTPPPVDLPEVRDDVKVEGIARRVPAECFYVRCRSFRDFVWLRRKVEELGGSARNLTAVRGLDYGFNERLETQLALKETFLSRLLGDAVISDLAVVGTDTFFREGAACGILFEARSSLVLAEQLKRLRREAAQQEPLAQATTVRISEHDVALLSTPDNRIRSFYATDGDYHLITTSRRLVERFYETGRGVGDLGSLDEFRYARNLMPADRGDAVFVYLSDPFFRGLVGPKYRVEMTRRMQALAEIELVQLARLAARAEHKPHDTIEELIEGRFLPDAFLARPDGSHTVIKNGSVVDSLRGARGAFLPIPDVEIERVTHSERQAYAEFASFYRRQWERMDPVIIAVTRAENGAREKIVLDVHITPYARRHYGWLAEFLAPPDTRQLAPVAGDLLSAQLRLDLTFGGAPRGHEQTPSIHLFGGLHDYEPSFSIRNGYVEPDRESLRHVNGYLGAEQELLRRFNMFRGEPDADGYVEHGSGHFWNWERRLNDLCVVAYRKEILERVTPQLKFTEAERPAQLRFRIADLSDASVARILHAMGYLQARRTSGANAQFLNTLMEQLHVDPKSTPEFAERILDARLACPLGGDYRLPQANGFPQWRSTAWHEESLYAISEVAEDYRFPLLERFRGLDIEFSIDRTTLTTRVELELRAGGP